MSRPGRPPSQTPPAPPRPVDSDQWLLSARQKCTRPTPAPSPPDAPVHRVVLYSIPSRDPGRRCALPRREEGGRVFLRVSVSPCLRVSVSLLLPHPTGLLGLVLGLGSYV